MQGEPQIVWGLFIVFALVLINAFFVAAEYAFVRVRRMRIEALAAKGSAQARVVLHALNHLNRYIAGVQVGITLVGLASGRFGEPALARILDPLFARAFPADVFGKETSAAIGTTLTLIIITYLLVVLSELVPKALTLRFADRIALAVAKPMRLIIFVFTPLVWSMNAFGGLILRLFRLPPSDEAQRAYSVEELKLLLLQSHRAGILDDIEQQLMRRSIQFADLVAADVLISRPDMVALDVSLPVDELLSQVTRTPHTRFPVYEGTIDNIIGVLHLQELFKQVVTARHMLNVRELVRPALFIPETIGLEDVLEQFRRRRTQIAIIVDEHGGTVGLVTLEDVVEEVFGEIQDALEAELPTIQAMPDGRVLVRGEVRLHELVERLGWSFEDAATDTIAGYVMQHLGRIARLGDSVHTPGGMIRVENMAGYRITQVALIKRGATPPPADPTREGKV